MDEERLGWTRSYYSLGIREKYNEEPEQSGTVYKDQVLISTGYIREVFVSFIQSYGIVSYSSQDLFGLSIIILILNDKLLEHLSPIWRIL